MKRATLALSMLGFFFLHGCGDMAKGKAAAQSQVPIFHRQLNEGDMKGILSGAHPLFTRSTSEAEVVEFLGAVRKKLGNVTGTSNAGWNVKTMNGVTRVSLTQETTFESGKATESFTFQMSQGKALLLGYNIHSRDLVVK